MHPDDQYRPYYERSIGARIPPVCKMLLIVTVAVFLAHALAAKFFLPPPGPHAPDPVTAFLGLSPERLFGSFYIWQLLTYIFLHSRHHIFHILFNMLFLYWFGRDIETRFGSRRFLAFYLTAGAFAGLAYCASRAFSEVGIVIGASGAIMAILVVYAIYFPNRMILFMFMFPMRIRNFVLLMVGLDLYMTLMHSGNGVATVAHLGGAAYGVLYIKFWPAVSACLIRRQRRQQQRRQIREQDEDSRLDAVLDKVHREGLPSLSRREKDFLVRMSRRKRD